jgi:hypothetical protein
VDISALSWASVTTAMYLYLIHEYQLADLLDNFQSYNIHRMSKYTRQWKQMHDLLDAGLLKKADEYD